jgi:hypothetical protein
VGPSVGQQIVDDLVQPNPVAEDHRLTFQLDCEGAVRRDGGEIGSGVAGERTRSTGSRSSDRCWSSRASSSRSSTSRPIRPASASIRPIARATASAVGEGPLAIELGVAAQRGQGGE